MFSPSTASEPPRGRAVDGEEGNGSPGARRSSHTPLSTDFGTHLAVFPTWTLFPSGWRWRGGSRSEARPRRSSPIARSCRTTSAVPFSVCGGGDRCGHICPCKGASKKAQKWGDANDGWARVRRAFGRNEGPQDEGKEDSAGDAAEGGSDTGSVYGIPLRKRWDPAAGVSFLSVSFRSSSRGRRGEEREDPFQEETSHPLPKDSCIASMLWSCATHCCDGNIHAGGV